MDHPAGIGIKKHDPLGCFHRGNVVLRIHSSVKEVVGVTGKVISKSVISIIGTRERSNGPDRFNKQVFN
jgi:hypothetical protein